MCLRECPDMLGPGLQSKRQRRTVETAGVMFSTHGRLSGTLRLGRGDFRDQNVG